MRLLGALVQVVDEEADRIGAVAGRLQDYQAHLAEDEFVVVVHGGGGVFGGG